MATIYPEWLPDRDDVPSSERVVFKLFKENLGDEYTVFHGVRMQPPGRKGGVLDREIDFLVAHPEHGLLVLEVKGGGIYIDGKTKQWHSRDRYGKTHKIDNPLEQARKAQYILRDLLQEIHLTSGYEYPIQHAAALTDVDVDTALYPNASHQAILDKSELLPDRINEAVQSIFEYYHHPDMKPPRAKGIKALTHVLARSWYLRSFMATDFEYEEQQVKQLTKEQFALLEFIRDRPRALIAGCAGSGKTMLAVEKARRLAEIEGLKVLFTCYNKNLAEWLQASDYTHSNITFKHFHSLCATYAREQIDWQSEEAEGKEKFWSEHVPAALLDAATELDKKERFDAMIIDEGQDFKSSYWMPLQFLLKEPETGIMYIFYDDSQRIYSADEFPPEDPPFRLTKNLRNTRPIGELVASYYRGLGSIVAAGPDTQREPEFHTVKKNTTAQQLLEEVIEDLVGEKVPHSHIVILTPVGKENSQWEKGMRVGDYHLRWGLNIRGKEIAVETIQSFKGLERPVVILTELDEGSPEDRDSLLYVALSRASNHLIVIGELPKPGSEDEHGEESKA